MSLFKKKTNKTTEEKFEQEKKERALITIVRMFRNDKLNLPETDLSRAMIGFCDQIDPDHKMPERDLIQKLGEREDISQYLASINDSGGEGVILFAAIVDFVSDRARNKEA